MKKSAKKRFIEALDNHSEVAKKINEAGYSRVISILKRQNYRLEVGDIQAAYFVRLADTLNLYVIPKSIHFGDYFIELSIPIKESKCN